MANVLGLALKITGDASGLRLDPAQRALQRLGEQTDKVAAIFDKFTGESTAAAQAQDRFQQEADGLLQTLRDGGSATEFARNFERIAAAAREEAAALQDAARITESTRTNFERFQQRAGELAAQLNAGRITQDTYNRAVEQAAKGLTDAERSAAGLADRTEEISTAGSGATLQFNELSGIFAILPGPLGNIAGRISGITSASDGLSRIFSGGLRQGIASLGSSLASLATPANIAIAAIGGIASVLPRISAAVDQAVTLGEEISKSSVIFGESAARVSQFAESASAIGLSANQALQATGTFGNLFRAIGLTTTQSAEFAVSLTGLASDLASFNNTTTDDAIQALGAALRGESEPIRRYGVLLDDATLRQIAFEKGITDTVRALAPAEKAQAAYAAILQQTTNAQGDFERTSGSLANLQRVLGATLDNITTELGQQFLPVFQAFTELANSAAPLLQTLFEALRPLTSAAGALAQTVVEILTPLTQLLNAVLRPLSGVILPAIIAQLAFLNRGAIVGVVVGLGRAFTAATAAAVSFAGGATSAAASISAVGAAIRATLNSTGIGLLVTTFGLAGGYLLEWATSANDATDGTSGLGDAANAASASVAELRTQLESPLREGFADAFAKTIDAVKSAADEVRRSADGLTGEFARQARERIIPLQSALAAYQRQLRDADTTAEVERINAAIGRTTENYIRQIGVIKTAAEERQKQLESERRLADQIIDQLRIQEQFGGDARRAQAAEAVLVIQREILRTEREVERLKFTNNQEGFTAAQSRLASLRQAFDVEQQIALGIKQQADADAQRIARLETGSRARAEAEETILAIQREQARVLEQGIFSSDPASFEASQRRIAELTELQRQQEELVFAQQRGFAEGFAPIFEELRDRFGELREQAAEFGNAGAAAAARLQEGIALAQEQARDGILNREAFDAEVARREALFQQEIERVREVANERQRINELVDQRFLLARFGGDQQRLDAARNLEALEAEIGRVQADVLAARAAGDQAAVNAGIARLGQLDQVAAQERDIAEGRQRIEEQLGTQRGQYLQQLQQQQEQAQQEQEKFLDEQRKAIEAEQQRQAERIRELNTLGSGVIEGNDIRTAEGAALFLQLAANRQDPALIEARLQTRRLTEIRAEVKALVERLTGLPVLNIAGGAG